MKRFCGMMPASEVEKRSVYIDRYGDEVRIDAGPNGWTVYYCDIPVLYKPKWNINENNDFTSFFNSTDRYYRKRSEHKSFEIYEKSLYVLSKIY